MEGSIDEHTVNHYQLFIQ